MSQLKSYPLVPPILISFPSEQSIACPYNPDGFSFFTSTTSIFESHFSVFHIFKSLLHFSPNGWPVPPKT